MAGLETALVRRHLIPQQEAFSTLCNRPAYPYLVTVQGSYGRAGLWVALWRGTLDLRVAHVNVKRVSSAPSQ